MPEEKRARRTKAEKQAERYQRRLADTKKSVQFCLERGQLTSAVRIVLGFAEGQALELEAAEAVYPFQFKDRLGLPNHVKMREAWASAVREIHALVGLWLSESVV